jgi:hypothetical protein
LSTLPFVSCFYSANHEIPAEDTRPRLTRDMTPRLFRDGSWFAVPLQDETWAAGLAAWTDNRGAVIAFLFGPRRKTMPSLADLRGLSPNQASLVANVSDLKLRDGRWPVIGAQEGWPRGQWPMPTFHRPEGDWHWCVTYAPGDLIEPARELPVTCPTTRRFR